MIQKYRIDPQRGRAIPTSRTYCCKEMEDAWTGDYEYIGFDDDIQDLSIGLLYDDWSHCYYAGETPDRVVGKPIKFCPFCAAPCRCEAEESPAS